MGRADLPLSRADCLEIWEAEPSGDFRACRGLYCDWSTSTLYFEDNYFESRLRIVLIILTLRRQTMGWCLKLCTISSFRIVFSPLIDTIQLSNTITQHFPARIPRCIVRVSVRIRGINKYKFSNTANIFRYSSKYLGDPSGNWQCRCNPRALHNWLFVLLSPSSYFRNSPVWEKRLGNAVM
jgi:hypothetical protein